MQGIRGIMVSLALTTARHTHARTHEVHYKAKLLLCFISNQVKLPKKDETENKDGLQTYPNLSCMVKKNGKKETHFGKSDSD